MAAKRRAWESLSADYRNRLSRHGITRSQYENGRPLSGARGHGATPEHGLASAKKNPGKYKDYIRKRQIPEGGAPPTGLEPIDFGILENKAKDDAYGNIRRRLSHYIKYKRETVLANVYGGTTAESGDVPGMSLQEATWTVNADTEELRANASVQYQGNPWWYH